MAQFPVLVLERTVSSHVGLVELFIPALQGVGCKVDHTLPQEV
jgi:hypothetical protein